MDRASPPLERQSTRSAGATVALKEANAPLRAIHGFASLLREHPGERVDADTHHFLGRIAAERRGEHVTYVMRDNGVGFSMEHAANLFGIFQRLHNDARYPGTGVGLALVKRLIERHGGRITAQSEEGLGAEFRFTLDGGDPAA